MPNYRNTQALQSAINATLTQLNTELADAARGAPPAGDSRRRGPGATETARGASPTAQDVVAAIDSRIGRLEQVRDWIDEDEELAGLIDGVMSRRIRESERRLARLSVALNAVFLIAGWLLSLVGTPAALGAIFHH